MTRYFLVVALLAHTLHGTERKQFQCRMEQLIEDKKVVEEIVLKSSRRDPVHSLTQSEFQSLAGMMNDKYSTRSSKEVAAGILMNSLIHFGERVAKDWIKKHGTGNEKPEEIETLIQVGLTEAFQITDKALLKSGLGQELEEKMVATIARQHAKMKSRPTEKDGLGFLHTDLHPGNALHETVRPTTPDVLAEPEELSLSQFMKLPELKRAHNPVAQLELKETQERAQEIVATIDQDFHLLGDVLRAHFGLDGHTPKNLSEFAKDMGLTRERARTLRNKALRRFFVFAELQKRDAELPIKELWKFNPAPMEVFEALYDNKGRRLRSMERLAEREDISLDSVHKMRTKAFEMLELKLAYETRQGRKIFENLEKEFPKEGQVVRLLYGLGLPQPRPVKKLARLTARTATNVNDDRKAFVDKYFYRLERWRLEEL